MNEIQRAVLKAVEMTIDEKNKTLPFLFTVRGKVIHVSTTSNQCTVEIFGEQSICKTLEGTPLAVDDIVLVLTSNNDFNEKIILGRLGSAVDPEGDPPPEPVDGREVELRSDSVSGYIQWKYVDELSWTNLIAISALKGDQGIQGPAGADGRDIILDIYNDNISWRYTGDGTWTTLIAVSELEAADAKEVELRVNSTHIQWKYVPDSTWNDLIALSSLAGADGTNGTDGTEIELQNSGTNVQWRYVGDVSWQNLIEIASITGSDGADGREVEIRNSGTNIEWRYVGDVSWNNIVSVASITGADGMDGTDGESVDLQVTATHIQWKRSGSATWLNLITLSELKGADGIDGINGTDGQEVELQNSGTYIQWRYTGGAWSNLVAISALEGADGTNGTDGEEVELRVDSGYIQWKRTGDITWNNLILINDLKGDTGPGVQAGGTAGQILKKASATDFDTFWSDTQNDDIEFNVSATHLQWKYITDSVWINLVSLDEIKGEDGVGIPSGGTEGQVLRKATATEYDVQWEDEVGANGTLPLKNKALIQYNDSTESIDFIFNTI